MAKNRGRGGKTPNAAAAYSSKPIPSRWGTVLWVLLALGAAWGLYLALQIRQSGSNFNGLLPQGQAALSKVQTGTDAGRGHSAPGQALSYAADPPTSGTHSPQWVDAGFYQSPQARERLVHSLEHGNVVIYYDQPGREALDTLRAWAGQFRGQWDGVVVVPRSGIGPTVELTAWNKTLRLESWDAAAAAAFVDAYRGRGPENPVR